MPATSSITTEGRSTTECCSAVTTPTTTSQGASTLRSSRTTRRTACSPTTSSTSSRSSTASGSPTAGPASSTRRRASRRSSAPRSAWCAASRSPSHRSRFGMPPCGPRARRSPPRTAPVGATCGCVPWTGSGSASTPEGPSSCGGSRSSAALPRLGAMTGGHRVSARVAAWAGVDTDWERCPHDAAHARRVDTWVALAFLVTASLGVELLRSIDALGAQEHSWLWPHVAVALGTVPLVWRRRWPLTVAAGLSLHLFAFGILMPSIAVSMPMQVVYFFALFTGVAWARDRRAMLGVVVGVVLLMFGWLTWQFAVGSGVEEAMSHDGQRLTRQGLFSPPAAYVVYSLLVNVVYFGGAIIGGQAAWRAALQRDRLALQARTIDAQATSLQRQAVVEERLRIARELHDVVAHHVSVIGIQAAAARRVLRRDPDVAEGALRSVETSSRDAVAQMRGLLGTLRADDYEGTSDGSGPGGRTRAPEPGLADVTTLAREAST